MSWQLSGNVLGTANTDNDPLLIEPHGTEHLRITPDGNLGIGTTRPQHLLQIGDNEFGFDASDASPNIGYIRFGDNTGWKLHFGRTREKAASAGGTINTGTTGILMTIQDNGNVGIGTTTPPKRLSIAASYDGDGLELIGSQSQTKDVGVTFVDEAGQVGNLGLASAPNAW